MIRSVHLQGVWASTLFAFFHLVLFQSLSVKFCFVMCIHFVSMSASTYLQFSLATYSPCVGLKEQRTVRRVVGTLQLELSVLPGARVLSEYWQQMKVKSWVFWRACYWVGFWESKLKHEIADTHLNPDCALGCREVCVSRMSPPRRQRSRKTGCGLSKLWGHHSKVALPNFASVACFYWH